MSMISERVKRLREKAKLFSESGLAVDGIIKDYNDAADIIEELSEKLSIGNNRWIPCSERMPKPEEEVLVFARCRNGREIITTALYEDGTMREIDSCWIWQDLDGEWDEEEDCYIIPEGWWEYRHYNPDEVYNNVIDNDVVAWMPLPEAYKGE